MRVVLPIAILIFAIALMTSCFDPEPAEISVRTTKNGRPQGATVLVYGGNGNQINEVSTDGNGVGYIKKLAPGKYTLKFCNNQRDMYPAVVEVTVKPGDSSIQDVELTDGPAQSAEE